MNLLPSSTNSEQLLTYAGIGAGAAVLSSMIPFVGLVSPAIGGGVAGWLAGKTTTNGAKIGALTGGLLSLLAIPLLVFGILLFGLSAPIAGSSGLLLAPLFLLFAGTLGIAYLIGVGALGGYFGAKLRTPDTDSTANDTPDVDPVERLKQRYADGELTEFEFERRLEQVMDDKTEQRADDRSARTEYETTNRR